MMRGQISRRLFLLFFLIMLFQPFLCPNENSSIEKALPVCLAAVEESFGPVQFLGHDIYYGLDDQPCAYSFEFKRIKDLAQINVIACVSNNNTNIMMAYQGISKHKDKNILSTLNEKISTQYGKTVQYPIGFYWIDRFEIWAKYPEIDPLTQSNIAGNLLDLRIATFDKIKNEIAKKSFQDTDLSSSSKPYIDFDKTNLSRFIAVGDSVTISGVARDSNGNLLKNYRIGVDDGLALMCTQSGPTTDSYGKFTYTTRAKSAGVAEVAFYLPSGHKQAAYVNVSKSASSYSSPIAGFRNVYLRNKGTKTLGVTVNIGGVEKSTILSPNQSVFAIQSISKRDHFPVKATPYIGVVYGGGLSAGGVGISTSINSDGTIDLTAGLGPLLRGKVYVTLQGDYGACWAPGVDLNAGPIQAEIEGMLCLGTDGVSIGAGGSTTTAAAGITIKLWEPTSNSKSLSSISVNGPAQVNENSYADYTAVAKFSDNTTQNVTSSSTWTENSSYAYMDSQKKGRLITTSVSSDKKVTVTASYTYNGKVKNGSIQVTIKNK